MRRFHLLGLILWRGGLVLVAGYALLEAIRWILRFYDIPALVEVGLGLTLAGLVFVLVSLVLERIGDARAERQLGRPGEDVGQARGGSE